MKSAGRLNKAGHLVAFAFAMILLYAGKGYLNVHPLEGALLLFVFSALYLLGLGVLGRGYLIYPLVLFGIVSYYLFMRGVGLSSYFNAVLAVPPVAALLLSGRRFRRQEFYTSAYLVTLFFSVYLVRYVQKYMEMGTWAASLPLLVFSGFYMVRQLDTRRIRHLYFALMLFSLSFGLALYEMPAIPTPYYGLFFIGLCMGMMALGNRYQNRSSFVQVSPLYVVGLLLSLIAFLYSARSHPALLFSFLLFSVHYFGISRNMGLKPGAWKFWPMMFYRTFFALGNVSAYICIVLLFVHRFPRTISTVLVTLGYAVFYRLVGFGRRRTVLGVRNQYVYLFGVFLTAFYLLTVIWIDPLNGIQGDMFFAFPLLGVILGYGLRTQRKGQKILADSLYEAGYVVVVAALLLPHLTGTEDLVFSSLLAAGFLILYGVFGALSGNRVLAFPPVMIFLYLYYALLAAGQMNGTSIGLVYLPIGVVSLIAATYLRRKGAFAAEVLYFAFFLSSGISVGLSSVHVRPFLYTLTAWAALYLGATELIRHAGSVGIPEGIQDRA